MASEVIEAIFAAVPDAPARKPFVLGLCGAQGSGKSTLARAIVDEAAQRGLVGATISLDDMYFTRREREVLGRDVHPLLRTRGVPGTHDVALGLAVFDALDRGEPAALPRFDKASDDRLPPELWDRASGPCDLLVFEGWCVGARPQAPDSLVEPVNDLEAREDPDARWRTYVNAQLAGPYQRLFGRIDSLILLAAPTFDVVFDWRLQQEADLGGRAGPGVMDAEGIAWFIRHYERLTRHILAEMPARADLTIHLAPDRTPIEISRAAAASR